MATTLLKALSYAIGRHNRRNPYGGVVLELKVEMGKLKELALHEKDGRGRPMRTHWHLPENGGYDSAFAPAVTQGAQEEHCVRDPTRVRVVNVILQDTADAEKAGYSVRDGRLVFQQQASDIAAAGVAAGAGAAGVGAAALGESTTAVADERAKAAGAVFCVEGAGSAGSNGYYKEDGTCGGKPKYRPSLRRYFSDRQIWWNSRVNQWTMGGGAYRNRKDSATPPSDGWEVNDSAAPAPWLRWL